MNIRLYFALWPDDGIRLQLSRYRLQLAREGNGRAVFPVTLHMTLAFLGDIDAALVPLVEKIGTVWKRRHLTTPSTWPGVSRKQRWHGLVPRRHRGICLSCRKVCNLFLQPHGWATTPALFGHTSPSCATFKRHFQTGRLRLCDGRSISFVSCLRVRVLRVLNTKC